MVVKTRCQKCYTFSLDRSIDETTLAIFPRLQPGPSDQESGKDIATRSNAKQSGKERRNKFSSKS